MKAFLRSVCVVLATFVAVPAPSPAQDIERLFADPPPDSRMATYWWIFGPAWTRPEIERELKVLQKAGIGRVMIFPMYPYEVDDPGRGIRNMEYLSPQFLETFQYAVTTANQLGMSVDLVMGTGWPYGGPMIPDELSPRSLLMKTVPFTARPGQEVTVALPSMEPGDDLLAVHLAPVRASAAAAKEIDLTPSVRSGRLTFRVPEGEWELIVFIQGLTRQRHKVVFAAAGAGGNAIDHLDKRAVDLYLNSVSAKLASVITPRQIRAMYSASFEVNGTSWSPGFAAEFRKRRGYDLLPYLSALFRGRTGLTPHLRHDFWNTIAEVARDHYLNTVADWCHQRGFGFQGESYGVPSVNLGSFVNMDYPMGEDYNWKEFNRVRWAASAARFYNRDTVNVEAYTWLRMARYSESLLDLKLATDLHFVSGANRIVAHGYAYSPPSAGVPGWGYYAGAMLTEHAPWWSYMPILSKYIHRAGYILSQGRAVADVALYLPEGDLAAEFEPSNFNLAKEVLFRLDRVRTMADYGWGLERHLSQRADVIETIVTNGYSLDGIDHAILSTVGKVEGSRLRAGQGSYPIVVLPGLEGMPLGDLEKVAEFCRNGGTLIATLRLPETAYGFLNRDRDSQRFKALMAELYGGVDLRQPYAEKAVGRGKAIFTEDETAMFLRALRTLPEDLRLEGAGGEIGFVHRTAGKQDFYFLANLGGSDRFLKTSFRVGNRKPRVWDPMTGQIKELPYRYLDGRTELDLRFSPFSSAIVEFGESAQAPPPSVPPARARATASDVKSPWRVAWLGLPSVAPKTMTGLKSWTDYPETRYFSGKATYETTVDIPGGDADSTSLDLGKVRDIAEVWVNGKEAGVLWKPPYELDVTRLLRPGKNTIRVDVSNLLINHVLSQPVKDYSDVAAKYPVGIRIPPPREKALVKEPFPSGLLGPVRIRFSSAAR